MGLEFVCRRCGQFLLDQEAGDARLIGCPPCGWELSIPCGEPLTLEVSEPETWTSSAPEPAPSPSYFGLTPAARLVAIGALAGLGAWLRTRRQSWVG